MIWIINSIVAVLAIMFFIFFGFVVVKNNWIFRYLKNNRTDLLKQWNVPENLSKNFPFIIRYKWHVGTNYLLWFINISQDYLKIGDAELQRMIKEYRSKRDIILLIYAVGFIFLIILAGYNELIR